MAATEFRPGNRRVVHHALFFLDAYGQARRRDGEDGQPGYTSFGGIGVLPSGGLGGWAPGATPRRLPDGTGMFLAKGTDLVMQIHYHPDGKEETDLSSVGIYFTSKPATTIVGGIALRTRTLDIPPGEKHYTVHAESQPLPADVKALAIFPHMHNLGREMKVTAYPPSGGEVPMIWIRDWDFNWQGAYRYRQPVSLPKGTVVKARCGLRQFARQPQEPQRSAAAGALGRADDRRNVPLRHDGRHQSPADLRKVRAMNFAQLAAIMGGGSLPDDRGVLADLRSLEIDAATRKKILARFPPDGFAIPEASKGHLAPFDRTTTAGSRRRRSRPCPNRFAAHRRSDPQEGGGGGRSEEEVTARVTSDQPPFHPFITPHARGSTSILISRDARQGESR